MYVGTILKKDNSVEIKTRKIELIKKYFDEKLSSIKLKPCLLYTSPSPRDTALSRMPSSA